MQWRADSQLSCAETVKIWVVRMEVGQYNRWFDIKVFLCKNRYEVRGTEEPTDEQPFMHAESRHKMKRMLISG